MKYDPLPAISEAAQATLKMLGAWPEYQPDVIEDELFRKGLVCEGDGSGEETDFALYITNAGWAYLEGRRLPAIVIPDYETGEIDDSDECPDPDDDPRHDFPDMSDPYWDAEFPDYGEDN